MYSGVNCLKLNRLIEDLLKKQTNETGGSPEKEERRNKEKREEGNKRVKPEKDEEKKEKPRKSAKYELSQKNQKITDQFEIEEEKRSEDHNALAFHEKQRELRADIEESKTVLDRL